MFHASRGKTGLLEETIGKAALEGEIVDGNDRAHPGPEGIAAPPEGQKRRGQGRVPVLGVDNARLHAQMADRGQGGATEKDESFAVVEIIAFVGAVIIPAVEIFAALDEVYGQSLIVCLVDVGGGIGPGVPHRAVLVHQVHGILARGQAAVEGRDHGDAHAHAA